MTLEAVNRVQQGIIEKTISPESMEKGAQLAQHLVYLRHLEYSHEQLQLRFGAPDGVFRFSYRNPGLHYLDSLLEALEDSGVPIDYEVSLPELRPR